MAVLCGMPTIQYSARSARLSVTLILTVHYVGTLLGFLYICTNPFIYAVKFNPVRRVLLGLIPWKNSEQAGEGVEMAADRVVHQLN